MITNERLEREKPTGKCIIKGTWLRDRRAYRDRLGVVSHISESGRIGIRWRPDTYQNLSVSMFINHLREGDWVLDQ